MNLAAILENKIKKYGPIPFHDFMSTALYHEKYGYYRQSSFPAGGRGDFVTSPHTSRIFGALIANQIEEFHEILEENKFVIVEMGAGAGYLARDILTAIKEIRGSISDITYIIIEPSRQTERIQKEIVAEYSKNITWLPDISHLDQFSGCLLSNELLDSFPVNVVQKENDGWKELYVDLSETGFTEVFRSIEDSFIDEYLSGLPKDLPVPYRTEINKEMYEWVKTISKKLIRGFILTIDYGYTASQYFSPHRNRGTVLGYYSQNVIDNVLQYPGLLDITAHVNFSDLHRWGKENGLTTVGYSPQYAFLGGLDFENTFKRLYKKVDPFSPEMAAVKMLIMPQGMGDSHNVMIQEKNVLPKTIDLSGFKLVNRVSNL